jgi:hypothetical protein
MKPPAIDSDPDGTATQEPPCNSITSPIDSIRSISRPSSKCSKRIWDSSSRSPTANRDADKLRSQISFLSQTPRSDLEALADWARRHGMNAEVGSYSDREFYLDAPEAFVDFVIEAMRPELADYDSP